MYMYTPYNKMINIKITIDVNLYMFLISNMFVYANMQQLLANSVLG